MKSYRTTPNKKAKQSANKRIVETGFNFKRIVFETGFDDLSLKVGNEFK